MRDGSDVAGEPKPKRSLFKRWQDWMDSDYKMGYSKGEAVTAWGGLAIVLVVLGTVIYWMGEWERRGREERCEGIYATVPCLERLLEEAKAKEAYDKQLEQIKNVQKQ